MYDCTIVCNIFLIERYILIINTFIDRPYQYKKKWKYSYGKRVDSDTIYLKN